MFCTFFVIVDYRDSETKQHDGLFYSKFYLGVHYTTILSMSFIQEWIAGMYSQPSR